MKPLDKRLGCMIRAARKQRGLSQKELARRCGISRRHLIAIELGANFTVTVLIALSAEIVEIAPVVVELLRPSSQPSAPQAASADVTPDPIP